MRLVQFLHNGSKRTGIEVSDNGDIVDVCAIDSSIPKDTRSFLDQGEKAVLAATRAVESGKGVIKRDQVQLKAPIENPEKIICLGMNYVDHCLEQNQPMPEKPILFFKLANSIIGQGEPIIYSDIIKELDHEVELAIIIGKTGHNLKKEEAMEYVFGYTVAHDVTDRYWTRENNGLWSLGKTFDTFCPLGPAIVTKDSLSDPHKLGIRCRVNGKTMQDSNTENLIFKTASAVSYISQFMTLKPGDVILTGTPPGVGCFRKPPEFLKKGDVVEVEIDEIGCLSNPIQ